MSQEWQFTLQDDQIVTPILRLGDYPLVPEELRLLHAEDFRDEAGAKQRRQREKQAAEGSLVHAWKGETGPA